LDLLLVDHLLAIGRAKSVTLHLKRYPYFVSDATPADVAAALEALSNSGDCDLERLATRVQAFLSTKEIRLVEDPFWVSASFFSKFPPRLATHLAQATLAIVKGDANYRRLVGDYHWPPTTPFAAAVRSFPCSALALRTLKSELAVGLPRMVVERMPRLDPEWMVDGSWGIAQSYLRDD
jgi:hypothetical protein